jgi:hypothetical protein
VCALPSLLFTKGQGVEAEAYPAFAFSQSGKTAHTHDIRRSTTSLDVQAVSFQKQVQVPELEQVLELELEQVLEQVLEQEQVLETKPEFELEMDLRMDLEMDPLDARLLRWTCLPTGPLLHSGLRQTARCTHRAFAAAIVALHRSF